MPQATQKINCIICGDEFEIPAWMKVSHHPRACSKQSCKEAAIAKWKEKTRAIKSSKGGK